MYLAWKKMLQWQHHVWKIAMNWKKTWKKHGKNKPVWFCFAKGSRFHRSHELNKIKLVFSGPRLKTWGTQCAMMWIRAPRNVKPAISMWKWIGSWDGNPGSKTTRITTAWLMDTWTVLDDYSETGKKNHQKSSHICWNPLASGAHLPASCGWTCTPRQGLVNPFTRVTD